MDEIITLIFCSSSINREEFSLGRALNHQKLSKATHCDDALCETNVHLTSLYKGVKPNKYQVMSIVTKLIAVKQCI